MLISTTVGANAVSGVRMFQSLDWVDVDFDDEETAILSYISLVSIPRLG